MKEFVPPQMAALGLALLRGIELGSFRYTPQLAVDEASITPQGDVAINENLRQESPGPSLRMRRARWFRYVIICLICWGGWALLSKLGSREIPPERVQQGIVHSTGSSVCPETGVA